MRTVAIIVAVICGWTFTQGYDTANHAAIHWAASNCQENLTEECEEFRTTICNYSGEFNKPVGLTCS